MDLRGEGRSAAGCPAADCGSKVRSGNGRQLIVLCCLLLMLVSMPLHIVNRCSSDLMYYCCIKMHHINSITFVAKFNKYTGDIFMGLALPYFKLIYQRNTVLIHCVDKWTYPQFTEVTSYWFIANHRPRLLAWYLGLGVCSKFWNNGRHGIDCAMLLSQLRCV